MNCGFRIADWDRPAQAHWAKQSQSRCGRAALPRPSGLAPGPEAAVQNKPNSRRRREGRGPRGGGREVLYKQSQLPPWRQEGQRLARKGVMVNRTSDRPRQNKANFGKPGWDPGSRLCKTKPIRRRGRSCDIASMPRFGKQSQFPPRRGTRPAGGGRGAIAQNKANSREPARPGGRLYKQTQFLPLCRSGDRRSRGVNRAKQTQFAPACCK
jgi:hypothetical protein